MKSKNKSIIIIVMGTNSSKAGQLNLSKAGQLNPQTGQSTSSKAGQPTLNKSGREVVTVSANGTSTTNGGKRRNKNRMNGGVASVRFDLVARHQPSDAVMQRATTADMFGGRRRTYHKRIHHKRKHHKRRTCRK